MHPMFKYSNSVNSEILDVLYFSIQFQISMSIFQFQNPLPSHAKLLLFKAAILPHLTYCGTAWHFFAESLTGTKSERLQERALRIVFNSKLDFYKNLLKQANLTTLNNRRLQDIAISMFKAKNKLSPKYLQDLFITQEVENRRYILRNSDFTMPPFNTVKLEKRFNKFNFRCLVGYQYTRFFPIRYQYAYKLQNH